MTSGPVVSSAAAPSFDEARSSYPPPPAFVKAPPMLLEEPETPQRDTLPLGRATTAPVVPFPCSPAQPGVPPPAPQVEQGLQGPPVSIAPPFMPTAARWRLAVACCALLAFAAAMVCLRQALVMRAEARRMVADASAATPAPEPPQNDEPMVLPEDAAPSSNATTDTAPSARSRQTTMPVSPSGARARAPRPTPSPPASSAPARSARLFGVDQGDWDGLLVHDEADGGSR